ncbi:MAG: cytidylate kinase [Gallionellales bacterium 35-53-114]|jgi:3-phosphoshikimate 1-carboxyvinyltransferase|nr:MAG: cytidylate kinase [Gallionellales bacterium 35-53-114]OYZ65335.1 MAG: cytidylate kinase [Gallionellales bacterium 24-53-125]OZB08242.1 MAG: cytidylate kinase [Gallionellales bacterium 39-52-133]HQS58172.1 bifunctional 3-phosphoshikimate 1-carboxyvinyltransferase/cytidylate kinase [Gallionellaceae bacterium]HQS73727.1 bifunctional 3-phosphoshikimate 1-carboxyvinyltransferase/cytidylate kinase [Gallionellaceae bacterium]
MQTDFIDLPPLLSARGTVRLPGSKSISNRVLLLSALANGTTEVRDLLHSDDTERMLDALQALGIKIEALGDHAYRVTGCAGNIPVKEANLFLGNAGTAFRPLTAALALAGGHYVLSGGTVEMPGGRMHERPIGDLVDALRQLGTNIRYQGNEGFPPLEISPAMLAGDMLQVRGDVSSQFLTGLLMALPLMGRTVSIEVVGDLISKPYIEITLAMMARFGVKVERQEWKRFVIFGGQRYQSPGVIFVEGDASSASYFLAAGAIGGGPVKVEGVGKDSVQGDVRFAEALRQMGAEITMGPNSMVANGPANGKLKAIDLDCNHIPDAAMTLAVAALFADGTTTLRNIASWRVKETDRIAAMAIELRKVGATVEEGADYIRITPPASRSLILNPQSGIDTYDDHRMAMCFSLAAFGGAGIRINDPGCVAKTFPEYFNMFKQVTKPVPVIAIDGPSASGKGTVAQRVAQALGFHYLDSGALYRLLALAATRRGMALDNEAALAELALQIDIRFEGADIWLDGAQVGDELRTEQSGAAASKVAALPAVRSALLDRQKAFRQAPGLVADGRDMASVVFPDAVTKIFLTASAEARADRRYKQLMEKGNSVNIVDLLQEIRLRDERDSQRSVAPLQQAPGAILLDTTSLNIEQAVSAVLAQYRIA